MSILKGLVVCLGAIYACILLYSLMSMIYIPSLMILWSDLLIPPLGVVLPFPPLGAAIGTTLDDASMDAAVPVHIISTNAH